MKKLFFLSVLFTVYFLPAQTIVDDDYPCKVVSTQNVSSIKPGKYIFKDAFDYSNFRAKWDNQSSVEPVFFSNDEIGVIYKASITAAGSVKIDSVVETENSIIITIKSSASNGTQIMSMKEITFFLALKKTDKEIIFE